MLNPTRSLLTAVTALSVLSIGACSGGEVEKARLVPNNQPLAEEIMAPWASDIEPGVAVAVSLNDEVIFARGAGLASIEHRLPITPDSVFQAASLSKQFTAFAVFLLVSEGQVDLDADVRTYIPELPVTNPVITVRHLLDHTSGLREQNTLAAMAGWMPDDIHTRLQLFELITRQQGVNFPAGSEIEYSNTGYGLLAEIVARVSGQSFSSFMEARVFNPLGMSQTHFPEDRNALIRDRATSYYPDDDGFRPVLAVSEATGSTGLYTSALDLLRWAENFETREVGSADVFAMMAARFQAANGDVSTFGRGQERRLYNGIETWSHGGRDAGYRSFLLRVPDRDIEVAVLSNRTDFDTAEMAFGLLDVFLGDDPEYGRQEIESWPPATPQQLDAYAGDYEVYPGVIFSIRTEKGGLTITSLGASRDDLQAMPQVGPGEFLLNEFPEQVLIFDEPVDGQSPAFGVRHGLHGTIKVPRVELVAFDKDHVDLEDYTGRCFSHELNTFYDFSRIDDKLLAKHPRLSSFTLNPYQPDVFVGKGPLQKLEWLRDLEGQVTGFLASGTLAEGVQFICSKTSPRGE